ncbi:MAG: FAD:protein FMN transferase [Bacteroidales bacterium]
MKQLFVTTIMVLFLFACGVEQYHTVEGGTQGTTFRIVYKSNSSYDIEIYSMLEEIDNSLSVYNEKSIISRINRNEANVELDALFIDFYNESREVFEKSDGYFDITVGPLVNAWGFGVDSRRTADSSKIDSIKAIVGMNKISLKNNRLIKADPRIYLDGNAIAQGQSVDYIADFFEQKGIENYLVEIGGEVRTKGVNDKGVKWKIGIDRPVENSTTNNRELEAIVNLSGKSLATSGNYRKFYEWNGIKYSHSINPKTGYPSRDVMLSATIVADQCGIADAFATACMVMGFDKAVEMLKKNKNIDAFFVYAGENGEFKTFMTEGFKQYLEEEIK